MFKIYYFCFLLLSFVIFDSSRGLAQQAAAVKIIEVKAFPVVAGTSNPAKQSINGTKVPVSTTVVAVVSVPNPSIQNKEFVPNISGKTPLNGKASSMPVAEKKIISVRAEAISVAPQK